MAYLVIHIYEPSEKTSGHAILNDFEKQRIAKFLFHIYFDFGCQQCWLGELSYVTMTRNVKYFVCNDYISVCVLAVFYKRPGWRSECDGEIFPAPEWYPFLLLSVCVFPSAPSK